MSYVIWSTMWHIVLPGASLTLCGRRVPSGRRGREVPPMEVFICQKCRAAPS